MPATISFISTMDHDAGQSRDNRIELFEVMEAPGSSDTVRLQGEIIVQLSGTATSIVAKVEHATRDPNSGEANWAPAETTVFSGDLSAGVAPRVYAEPATGFWRVTITSLVGGNCQVSIIGERT